MKRINYFLFLGICLLLLNACSPKIKKVNYQYLDQKNGKDSRITIYYQDDRIIKHVISYTESYSAYNLKNSQQAKKKLENIFDYYEGIKGLTFNLYYGKDKFKRVIKIDYNKADAKVIANLLNISAAEAEVIGFISFKKFQEVIENQGYSQIEGDQFKRVDK